ncbi:MAG: Na+/H+ antiporter [Nitrolancea sp.]
MAVESAIIIALLVVVSVAVFVRRVNLPYTIALVIMGLVLGSLRWLGIGESIPTFELTREVILFVFLPPLLFEASFDLEFESLRENLSAVSLLAVPGVVIGAFMIAGMLHFELNRNFETALVFGALIAATDPISVLAIFSRLGAPQRLATIVEGESLFNDGVAIVLFTVVLEIATTSTSTTTSSLASAVVEFLKVASGGGLVGLLAGLLAMAVLSRIDDHLIEITITTVVAFGSFLVAEELHFSGVIGVVVAGLVMGRARDTVMSPTTRVTLGSFWEYVGFLGNSMIFLLMGMRIAVPELLQNLPAIGLVMIAVLVSRTAIVALVNAALRLIHEEMPWSWVLIVSWGGLRGAVALALALSLPFSLAGREWIQLMAFGVVLISLLVQGMTMQPLLNWFGLGEPEHRDYERTQARLFALNRALSVLHSEQQRGSLLPGVVSDIRDEYEEAVRKEQENLESLEVKPGFFRKQQIRQTRRRALLTQRAALLELRRQGQLSSEAMHDLLEEVDAELVRLGQPDRDDQDEEEQVDESAEGTAEELAESEMRAEESAARTD